MNAEKLYRCPYCLHDNFTARGLGAHYCREIDPAGVSERLPRNLLTAITLATRDGRLSEPDVTDLSSVARGADVTGRALAMRLRDLKGRFPGYIDIVRVMGKYAVTEQRPFFGAKTTAIGLIAIGGSRATKSGGGK